MTDPRMTPARKLAPERLAIPYLITGGVASVIYGERSCVMPRYLIEKNIPGAGKLSPDALQAISQKSCSVLQGLGPQIQWVQSYVTGDKITCIYLAPNEQIIREHARQGGFPADQVFEVKAMIDPTTAE